MYDYKYGQASYFNLLVYLSLVGHLVPSLVLLVFPNQRLLFNAITSVLILLLSQLNCLDVLPVNCSTHTCHNLNMFVDFNLCMHRFWISNHCSILHIDESCLPNRNWWVFVRNSQLAVENYRFPNLIVRLQTLPELILMIF